MAFVDVTIASLSSFQEYCNNRIKKFFANFDFKFPAEIDVVSDSSKLVIA